MPCITPSDARKVAEDDGRAVHGWTFHHRLAEKISGLPLYMYTTHHAVWADAADEYILPVKVDDTELNGLPPNVGYVGISLGIDKIAELLVKKLQQ